MNIDLFLENDFNLDVGSINSFVLFIRAAAQLDKKGCLGRDRTYVEGFTYPVQNHQYLSFCKVEDGSIRRENGYRASIPP